MELILKTEGQEVKINVIDVTVEQVIDALDSVSILDVEITEWVGPRPKK